MKQQQNPVSVRLREMILRGELAPGERVREEEIASSLGTSRMPVRQALPALAEEGLLVPAGKRGYSVRAFTLESTLEALRLRAVLEGFAARVVAERGASKDLLIALRECLDEGDVLLETADLKEEHELAYADLNARFHSLILGATGMSLLETLTNRCNLVPFAAPSSVAFSNSRKRSMHDLLFYAHCQHHSIVRAIEARQPDRAEFLFREHALSQEESQMLNPASNALTAPFI
ncbi:GntR family transcriptional regulator [Burkholderia cenocepacia]|uniref:GntR family transcriptional regulator n=1 Tax=Burkholderia cenocepacia TaxID=95486 RepID=UPI0028656F51|nr:GntR family transcriptional regulator [Burkholderia cenocepacia]MDR8071386.1 GntR family transcriptional regulator [Burkholderia cenocepacia]